MTEARQEDFRADRVGARRHQSHSPSGAYALASAVIGDFQHLPGYRVLVTDVPGTDQLLDLPAERQRVFLDDMAILGRAVAAVRKRRDPQFRRINLEIQG